MLPIVGLSIALAVCLLSSGAGGKAWLGKGSESIKGASDSKCKPRGEVQREEP